MRMEVLPTVLDLRVGKADRHVKSKRIGIFFSHNSTNTVHKRRLYSATLGHAPPELVRRCCWPSRHPLSLLSCVSGRFLCSCPHNWFSITHMPWGMNYIWGLIFFFFFYVYPFLSPGVLCGDTPNLCTYRFENPWSFLVPDVSQRDIKQCTVHKNNTAFYFAQILKKKFNTWKTMI